MAPEPIGLVGTVTLVIALLFLASVSAVAAKRIRFPFTIGLVIVGLALALLADNVPALAPVERLRLTPDMILFVFIPVLIFESALKIDSRLLLKNIGPVLLLAGPGLIVSTFIVGLLITLLTPLPLGPALLFGGLISATDPVAVIALFKEVGAPSRLSMLVEGESVFNDATAIVVFQILLGIVAAGAVDGWSIFFGAGQFVYVFCGGLLVGMLLGYAMIRAIGFVRDFPVIQVVLTSVVAYAAFILADHVLGVSGVMGVVGAGLVVGWFGKTRFTPEVKEYLNLFWEYAVFVANSLIFLLVGLSEAEFLGRVRNNGTVIVCVLAAIAAVLVARGLMIFGLLPLYNRLPRTQPVDRRYQTVLFWGGLRGAVAFALALSVATDFAYRELIIDMTFGVALFTLLVSGPTMPGLLARLGLDRIPLVHRMLRDHARAALERAALERLKEFQFPGSVPPQLEAEVRARHEQALENARKNIRWLRDEPEYDSATRRRTFWTGAFAVERRTYRLRQQNALLSEASLRELEHALECKQGDLRRGDPPAPIVAVPTVDLWCEERVRTVIARLLPRSAYARAHRRKLIASTYEQDAAFVSAAGHVLDELDRLAELTDAGAETVAACRKYYEDGRDSAHMRLQTLAEDAAEAVAAVQRRILERTALDRELDALERMRTCGDIGEDMSRELRHALIEPDDD